MASILGKMSAPVEYTDVQIYNRVLTPAEVQEYVDCNTKRFYLFCHNFVLYLKLPQIRAGEGVYMLD